jgi:biotin transport system permease protein
MLTLTSPVETRAHGWPAGAKLAALAGVTAGLFALQGPGALAVALAGVAAGAFALGGGAFLRAALAGLRPLGPFVLVVALWHGVTGEVAAGAAVILRLAAAVLAATVVTMTTRLSDMIAVIERLARPLARVGLPPRALALALALALRFVPVLIARAGGVAEAWGARSPRRGRWRLVAPLAAAALDDAERVAEALRARGGAG